MASERRIDTFFSPQQAKRPPKRDETEGEPTEKSARRKSLGDLGESSASASIELTAASVTDSTGTDIADYAGRVLTFRDRKFLLENVWKPPSDYKFPHTVHLAKDGKGKMKNEKRYLNWAHFQTFPWLTFSKKKQGVYCLSCVMFPPSASSQAKTLVSEPIVRFEYLDKLKSHSSTLYHADSKAKFDGFQNAVESGADIRDVLETERSAKVRKNREDVMPFIETTELCGRSGIAFRGHRDSGRIDLESITHQEGNFRRLLRYRANGGDAALRKFLIEAPGNANFYSGPTQTKFVKIMGKHIRRVKVKEANDSGFWSVLADETPDAAHIEQMVINLRYVKDGKIFEAFLMFVRLEKQDADTIATKLLEKLQEEGLDMDLMVGQGYDGASTMKGEFNGVQAKIRKTYKRALYTHCSAHSLNLVLASACKVNCIRSVFAVVNDLYGFATHSTRRGAIFRKMVVDFAGKDTRKRQLVSLCETRWVSRHNALSVVIQLYQPVVFFLEQMVRDEPADAAARAEGLLLKLRSSEFLATLCCLNHVFGLTNELSELLQRSDLDLINALSKVDKLDDQLAALVRDPTKDQHMKNICDQANDLSKISNEADLTMPAGRGRRRGSAVEEADPAKIRTYYFDTIFEPFIKHVRDELADRFSKHADTVSALSHLIPNVAWIAEWTDVAQAYDFYEPLLPVLSTKYSAMNEFASWKQMWTAADGDVPVTAIDALSRCRPEAYPVISKLLQILATLPVSVATAERSFSTLKLLKTYLRSTTGQERTNGLGALQIHHDVPIDSGKVLDDFAAEGPHRLDFIL